MCKYCDNKENESIWKGEVWKIDIFNRELNIEYDLDSYQYISLEINFCPMCGKELILSMYS